MDPVTWIKDEFTVRCDRNRRYSLRAYARDLGISLGALSEILRGKRLLSPRMAKRLAPQLALDPRQECLFLNALPNETSRASRLRVDEDFQRHALADDQFRLIADWYHYGILSLMKTDDFEPSYAWISKRLGITAGEAELGIARLIRIGLVKRSGRKLTRTKSWITTTSEVPSTALKRSHKQSIDQAGEALFKIPVELRDITSTTVATDASQLQAAKKLIRDFHIKLQSLLESGPKTEVYNLNIQLVPVTVLRPSTEKKVAP